MWCRYPVSANRRSEVQASDVRERSRRRQVGAQGHRNVGGEGGCGNLYGERLYSFHWLGFLVRFLTRRRIGFRQPLVNRLLGHNKM